MDKSSWKRKRNATLIIGITIFTPVFVYIVFVILSIFAPLKLPEGFLLNFLLLVTGLGFVVSSLAAYFGRRNLEQQWLILSYLATNRDRTDNTKSEIMSQTIEPMIPSYRTRDSAISNFEKAFKTLLSNHDIVVTIKRENADTAYCLGPKNAGLVSS